MSVSTVHGVKFMVFFFANRLMITLARPRALRGPTPVLIVVENAGARIGIVLLVSRSCVQCVSFAHI